MRDDSRGQLLIEVLIALAILGLIASTFIGAMYTSLQAARQSDIQSTAFTLAKSQMEFAKIRELESYSDDDWAYTVTTQGEGGASASSNDEPDWWAPDDPVSPFPATLPDDLRGYRVEVRAESKVYLQDDYTPEEGIRIITVAVFHDNREIFSLYNYEVHR